MSLLTRRRWRSRRALWRSFEGGVVEALTAAEEEVLAEVPLEMLPKTNGTRKLAIDQEDTKKATGSLRHHVVDGIWETPNPFLVVLRAATGDAGVTRSRIDDPLESAEALKACGTRHVDEEETEEEPIARARKMNCKAVNSRLNAMQCIGISRIR